MFTNYRLCDIIQICRNIKRRYLVTYNDCIAITYTNCFIAGIKSTVVQIADTVVYYAGIAYLPIYIWGAS